MSPSDSAEIPAELRARIQSDPWARELGIDYLELRKGYCRVSLRLRSAGFYDIAVTTDDGTLVAVLHCVSHRLSAKEERPATSKRSRRREREQP